MIPALRHATPLKGTTSAASSEGVIHGSAEQGLLLGKLGIGPKSYFPVLHRPVELAGIFGKWELGSGQTELLARRGILGY